MSSESPFTKSSRAGGGARKNACSNGFDASFSFDFSEKLSSSSCEESIDVRGVSQLNMMSAFLYECEFC